MTIVSVLTTLNCPKDYSLVPPLQIFSCYWKSFFHISFNVISGDDQKKSDIVRFNHIDFESMTQTSSNWKAWLSIRRHKKKSQSGFFT